MTYAVVSTSLNPGSKSRLMARALVERLRADGHATDLLDLQELSLPLCDGDAAYEDARVKALEARLAAASGIVLAVPVYNFSTGAAAKNLIELVGDAFEGKVVGFVVKGSGNRGYMSVMGLVDSLILDFRCHILPRFVYADKAAFEGERITDASVRERLDGLAAELVRLTEGVFRKD